MDVSSKQMCKLPKITPALQRCRAIGQLGGLSNIPTSDKIGTGLSRNAYTIVGYNSSTTGHCIELTNCLRVALFNWKIHHIPKTFVRDNCKHNETNVINMNELHLKRNNKYNGWTQSLYLINKVHMARRIYRQENESSLFDIETTCGVRSIWLWDYCSFVLILLLCIVVDRSRYANNA